MNNSSEMATTEKVMCTRSRIYKSEGKGERGEGESKVNWPTMSEADINRVVGKEKRQSLTRVASTRSHTKQSAVAGLE